MTREALTNERWGFESSCFVCEPKNADGLRIPFFHDVEAGEVSASFTLGEAFSGAPAYLHGGVVYSVLDESMAWAAIAVGSQWAVTQESWCRFARPVRVGREHEVRARLTEVGAEQILAAAEIVDDKGRVCAEATATFVPLGTAQAVDAIGGDAAGLDERYVRGGEPPA